MATLYITLLLLFSMTKSTLAAPALTSRKTNFSIPAVRKKSDSILRKRQTGTVAATLVNIDTYNMISYTCPVIIGGQTLNLQFDTGSDMPWAFSTNLPPAEQGNHNIYNPSLSSTYQDTGFPFYISYTDGGSAGGELGSDTMNVGGVTVPSQAFGVANSVTQDFVTEPSDGILDLSLSRILPGDSNLPTFTGNLANVLSVPLFAAYLPYKANGAFDFGVINTDRYTGLLMYTAVDESTPQWTVDSIAYRVGDVDYSAPGVTAIIDSGSEFIYMQSSQVENYYAAVPNSYYSNEYENWVYPCSQTLPSISFLIGPTNYATISGANLVTGLKSEDGTICSGGIQNEGSDISINVYGLLFFSAYYCVFDFATPRFAMADIVVPSL